MSALSANQQHPPKLQARMAATSGNTTCGSGFGVWLVEKLLDITPKTHIIFLIRDIVWNMF